jgi:serine/threonine-protein kinase HipA
MSALDVYLGTTRVGLLERIDEWQHRFSFDPSWLADPVHPVLGQIFEDRKPRDLESTGTLPPWFDHLLPPQGGPLRRAISRQSGIEGDDDFALLELLGADLPGAVVLSPGTPSLALRPPAPPAPKSPIEGALRFSLAGMQWKLSVREQDRKLTLPLRGETGGTIAKFPSPTYKDLPRVELATMLWAKLSGIDVPPVRLAQASDIVNLPEGIPVGDGTIYLIERFDRRPDGTRVHIEDFGQVLDRPADDHIYEARYEHIAAFLAFDSSRRFQDVSADSFRPLAEVSRRSFDDVSTWVGEMVERVLAAWHEKAADLPYLLEERALIEAHLGRVPLARWRRSASG